MITWLQSLLQKHYKWFFTMLLVVIIVTFVFFTGGGPRFGTEEGEGAVDFYGYNLRSSKDVEKLQATTYLSYLLRTGTEPNNMRLFQEEMFARVAGLHLADQLNLPKDVPNLKESISQTRYFLDEKGNFDQEKYDSFLAFIKNHPLYSQAMVAEVLGEDYRLELVRKITTNPGYVLPYEAIMQVENTKASCDVDVAFIDFTDFQPEYDLTDEALNAYLLKNAQDYQVPEQISLQYILFNDDAFALSIEQPSEDQLKEFFNFNQNLFVNGDEDVEFVAVKSKVLTAYLNKEKREKAEEAADAFIYSLFEGDITFMSPEFLQLLDSNKLTLGNIELFGRNQIPVNTAFPVDSLKEALILDHDHYYTDVVPSNSGVGVLFVKERLEPRMSLLEEVKDELVEAYKEDIRELAIDQKINGVRDLLVQGLREDKPFATLAQENGMTVNSFKDLSLESADTQDFPSDLLSQVKTIPAGTVSEVLFVGYKGYILNVSSRFVPEVSVETPEVKDTLARLQMLNSLTSDHNIMTEIANRRLTQISGKEDVE